MSKKQAIEAVNKPLRVKDSDRKSASTSKKRTTSGSSRKKSGRMTPGWLHWTILALVVLGMIVVFYQYFIRPYEYRWRPCSGCKMYDICIPGNYEVHGIDISHYQNEIDWPTLKQCQFSKFPIRFIFIKATEGGDLYDTAFAQNFDSAQVYGFIRGAYHFYNPETDAGRQADFFISKVDLLDGDLPPVLDVERKGSKNEAELRNGVKRWLTKIEQHYGVKPILYTSHSFKTRYLTDSVLDSYPYWIAHYYVDSVKYKGSWAFWQHTDVGQIPGINERVDMNVFNGRLIDFMKMTIRKPVVEQKK